MTRPRAASMRLGRSICGDFEIASAREWLVTNGLGGYACGTVAGALTRRYHGWLVAAMPAPVVRVLLVPKIEETIRYDGMRAALSSDRWSDGTIDPQGHVRLESFEFDGTTPVWRFAFADALLERRLWMAHGANVTCVRYTLVRGSSELGADFDVFVDARDHHGSTRADDTIIDVSARDDGIAFAGAQGAGGEVVCADATWSADPVWYVGFDLARERERGLPDRDDHLRAARASATLGSGSSITFVLRALDGREASIDESLGAEERRGASLVEGWRRTWPEIADDAPAAIRRLVLSGDQFVVARDDGSSVIAGYPWFTDWGRDAMISLPGLALTCGRADVARSMLRTFSRCVDQGMIPNRFPDAADAPEYNTVDATLWFFAALRDYLLATDDRALAVDLSPTLAEIVRLHLRGTRYGIRCDPTDGLLAAGEPGVQLTWMDARVDDRVITPRIGKPVEVNALWYNALLTMTIVCQLTGEASDAYLRLAEAARAGFARFWNEEAGCCYDVIDGPSGADASIRPNQIFAVSLPDSPLDDAQMRRVVDKCARALLTSHGLRSLSPRDPSYRGTYAGDPAARDGAYHQGTVWAYLLGPFALAHHRAYGDAEAARAYLTPLLESLDADCVGTIGEIFDGDAPMRPRGAFAQAWSVAETLRAWCVLEKARRTCRTS